MRAKVIHVVLQCTRAMLHSPHILHYSWLSQFVVCSVEPSPEYSTGSATRGVRNELFVSWQSHRIKDTCVILI